MKRTSIKSLLAAGAFVLAAAAIVTPTLYGRMYSIPASVSVTLWLMTVVCLVLAWKVRAAKRDGARGIGLDNSQLNPLTVANFMLVGKASAWTGTLVGAAYAGVGTYVVRHFSDLVAASEDAWGVAACVLGGLAMAAAGVFLERQAEVPPPPDAAGAVS